MPKGTGYWNRRKVVDAVPLVRKRPGTFTQEEKNRCFDNVYEKCRIKRPELTPEQFISELEAGTIQIQLPDGQIIKFKD